MDEVPNSAGSRPPRISVPSQSCDSHMHIYDRRFGTADGGEIVDNATSDDYRRLQRRLGTSKVVIVTPRNYGVDNSVTLDAIEALGIDHARGVAVLNTDVSDSALAVLHRGGVRGIRFTLYTAKQAVTRFEMVEPLSRRVHELGWHVQLHWTADQIVQHESLLRRLPSTIVIDHMARLPVSAGPSHPAAAVVRALLDRGRTWIKLSGAYLDSQVGAAGEYDDVDATARAWVEAAPERLVWGSDWPHSTETESKPDDAVLIDLLARWIDDDATRHQVLVDNPARLYGFN